MVMDENVKRSSLDIQDVSSTVKDGLIARNLLDIQNTMAYEELLKQNARPNIAIINGVWFGSVFPTF